MRIIGVYNIKGGVGKTATAVNLAYLSAQAGMRTLVWDLDPQGAASYYFRIKPRIKGGGRKMLKGKRELDELIKGSDFDNLDLLPADFSYRNMDLMLGEAKGRSNSCCGCCGRCHRSTTASIWTARPVSPWFRKTSFVLPMP